MKKLIALLMVMVLAIGCAAAEGAIGGHYNPKGAGEDGKYRIAFVASWLGAEYFSNNLKVLQPILNEAGMDIELFGPADFDTRTEVQLSIIENLITSGEWDCIMLYADEPDAFVDLRLKSEEAGIPWIGYIMPPESNCGTLFMGDTAEQRAVANYEKIIDYVEAHWDLYKDLDVIEVAVAGHPSSYDCNLRCSYTGEGLPAQIRSGCERFCDGYYGQGSAGSCGHSADGGDQRRSHQHTHHQTNRP